MKKIKINLPNTLLVIYFMIMLFATISFIKYIVDSIIEKNNEVIVLDFTTEDLLEYKKDILINLVEKYETEFYSNRIPNEFNKAFLHHIVDNDERLMFYSLMYVESANFSNYIGKPNYDGSIDYGPSQLNSYNLENPLFLELYKPVDYSYINTTYTKYMILSYNLFKDLRNQYGDKYVFYTYNGGPKAKRYIDNIDTHKNSIFVRNIIRYDISIRNSINNRISDYKNYVTYNVATDFIQYHKGTLKELKAFNKIKNIYLDLDITNVIVENNLSKLKENVYLSMASLTIDSDKNDQLTEGSIYVKFVKRIDIKNEDDIKITLDKRNVFETVHIFVSNVSKIYFGTHYLYEFIPEKRFDVV